MSLNGWGSGFQLISGDSSSPFFVEFSTVSAMFEIFNMNEMFVLIGRVEAYALNRERTGFRVHSSAT